MVDALSPRRCQYVGHSLTDPAEFPPVMPVPDKYALVTDEQTNERKDKQKDIAGPSR